MTGRCDDARNLPGWMNMPWQHSGKRKKAYENYLNDRYGRDYLEYVELQSLRYVGLSEITKGMLLKESRKTRRPFTGM